MFVQSNYDLVVVVVPGETIEVKIEYNTLKYEKTVVENILSQLDIVLTQVIEHAEVEADNLAYS